MYFGTMKTNQRHDMSTLSDYYSDNEQPNDLDFNEMAKIAKYREAITRLQRRCEYMSQNNERLVRRLHYVKRITIQKKRDVELLKTRLDVYNDEWRTAQPESEAKVKIEPAINAAPVVAVATVGVKVRKPRKHKGEGKEQTQAEPASAPNAKAAPENNVLTRVKGMNKRKRTKSDKEKDPNAPKRPANPFFQFCQEQRSNLMDELNSELLPGQPELSKQELTRQLAQRWRSMDSETKQIYVNKYENSKKIYNQEMLSYKKDGGTPTSTISK